MTNSGSTRTIVQLFTKGCRMRGVERRTPPATVPGQPPAQGLYDPRHEHDACGVGFVVNIKGKKSHTIVRQALGVLINLLHRGACGCEPNTGDGAGILLQTPDKFLRRECDRLGIPLPQPKEYGCGLVFLPRDPEQRDTVRALLHSLVAEEGQRRSRSCTSDSAPTRSPPGRSRTPTATSPTTARSTRSAATSTGCAPARRSAARTSSATTSGRCCP